MSLLLFTILAPLAGFLALTLFGRDMHEKMATTIGVGAMAVAFGSFLSVLMAFLTAKTDVAPVFISTFYNWLTVGDFTANFALRVDGLSVTMMGVITGVGLLIHLFASWYMRGEKHFARFFSYLNLFVASMLILVLADNLLLMYLGWEGVGICSYLLIGFYYQNRENGKAAMKAFTVTRVGDVFLAIGLFVLFWQFGTLDIAVINSKVAALGINHVAVIFAATMLALGAFGKSAQIPLHTWLADAMAGPTPVSALIHAATMVTAGVYLIARMHPVFLGAPDILTWWVGGAGALSLLVAGLCALAQTDIKRVLAYSTMSQLGYMFVALSVGAWQVAFFHLMTHAFFKALLFLASGAVIISTHHEQNILKMGGLYKKIPLVFVSFLVGGGALVALPLVTVGFYSKEAILWETYATHHMALFWVGVVGAFITAFYTFRLIYLTFFGVEKTHAEPLKGLSYALPLAVLIVLSTGFGALIHPPLAGVLPQNPSALLGETHGKHTAEIIAMAMTFLGLGLAAWLYHFDKGRMLGAFVNSKWGMRLTTISAKALGFDALFEIVFVRPFLWCARLLRHDPADVSVPSVWTATKLSRFATRTQARALNSHALGFALGVACIAVIVLAKVVS